MSIKAYRALFEAGLVDCDRHCGVCGQRRLRKHGAYARHAVRHGTTASPIPIQRYLCRYCSRTHSLRPDLLWPRRSYVLPKIVAALSAHHYGWSVRRIAVALRIPRSTVQSWLRDGQRHLLPALRQWLSREVAIQVPEVDVARLAARPEGLALLTDLLRTHTAVYDPKLAAGSRCRWRFLLRYLGRRGLVAALPTTHLRPGKGTGPPRSGEGGGDPR